MFVKEVPRLFVKEVPRTFKKKKRRIFLSLSLSPTSFQFFESRIATRGACVDDPTSLTPLRPGPIVYVSTAFSAVDTQVGHDPVPRLDEDEAVAQGHPFPFPFPFDSVCSFFFFVHFASELSSLN